MRTFDAEGLQIEAIKAVEQWRFKPGMKEGHAVAVQAQVEVDFRLPGFPRP